MSVWANIQRHLGIPADGLPGPATAAAVAKALNIGAARHALGRPEYFYAAVRKVTGPLDQAQVETIEALLSAAAHWPTSWLAYGLATAWHEARLKPVEEIGKGRGRAYGVADGTGQIPYGRGLVQLTWAKNYAHADEKLNLGGGLVKNYALALRPDIAVAIMVRGMEEGWFTGKSLADYLPVRLGALMQFAEARRIINGTDKAQMIAGYAQSFQNALAVGEWA